MDLSSLVIMDLRAERRLHNNSNGLLLRIREDLDSLAADKTKLLCRIGILVFFLSFISVLHFCSSFLSFNSHSHTHALN